MIARMKHTTIGICSIWIVLFSTLLYTGCSTTHMVAVIKPQKTKSAWKNRIKVYIKTSSRNLMGNRLAVINASKKVVSVYPVDVRLEIPDVNITLTAVFKFSDYVTMRYEEATKQCTESNTPKRCSRYITRFFNRYKNVNVFQFGEIPPRKKETGYFAFNLPDPFNESTQSKRAKQLLKNKGRIHNGVIRVVVHSMSIESRQHEFVFPVKVITSMDEKPKLLRIMKYF